MIITGRKANRAYLAKIQDGEVKSTYEFQFNPSEDEKSREVEWGWASAQGTALPEAIFNRISSEKFTIQLLLDATEDYDAAKEGVRADIAAIEMFTMPDPERFSSDLGQVAAPPQARFGIGNDVFTVVMDSVNTRVVRRNTDMFPTRAYVDIVMSTTFTDISQIQAILTRNSELARKAMVSRRG